MDENSLHKNKKKPNIVILLIILMFFLLSIALSVHFFFNKEQKILVNKVNTEYDNKIQKLFQDINLAELMLEDCVFEITIQEIELQNTKEGIEKSIEIQKNTLNQLKTQITDWKPDLSDGLNVFNVQFGKFKAEIWQIKSNLRVLKSQKNQLEERCKLEQNALLSNEITIDTVLQNELEILDDKKLNLYDLVVDGIVIKRNGSEKPTQKADRIEKIRVVFTLAKTDRVSSGIKQVYLRIIHPNSSVLGGNDKEFIFEEKKLQYTSKNEISYTNSKKDVVMYIPNTFKNDLIAGNYRIELYTEGELIGESTLELK